jgi:hypothetical protein
MAMRMSRRDFLKLGGLAATTATVSACSALGRRLAQSELPESLLAPTAMPAGSPLISAPPGLPAQVVNPIGRTLNRAGYGPRPGDLERVTAIGLPAYLEEQLAPDSLDDSPAELLVRGLTYYPMEIGQLVDQEPADVARELGLATFGRALYSRRQLYEAMVEFWSDHFNIYLRKSPLQLFLKVVDDREVIRPHALGRFRDLLHASAHSPAMLVYLDNVRNVKGQPNENYARELMELHTLGVHGGYSQRDVQELARALSGWGVRRRGPRQGQFFFDFGEHDDGEKEILGHHFPAGQGEQDVLQALDILAAHPSTARFIATKLVRRFVADDPPLALVNRVAAVFESSGGDIKSLLRAIFLSEEFATAPAKLKRPYTFMLSALRALNCDLARPRPLAGWLERMGQPLFLWPAPNGYPDVSPAWAANLLPRWNFALALMGGQVGGLRAPLDDLLAAGSATTTPAALELLAGLTIGRPLDGQAQALFGQYVGDGTLTAAIRAGRLPDVVALLLASPAFQWS